MPVLVALFLSTGVAGQDGAPGFERVDHNAARGFDPSKAFAVGDLDLINTFNGNLTLQIPIGPSYATGASLSYRLQLVYNSTHWIYSRRHDSFAPHCNPDIVRQGFDYMRAYPGLESNAGLGWMLSLGQLYGPNDLPLRGPEPAIHRGGGWLYIAADGSRHEFFDQLHGGASPPDDSDAIDLWYTNDSSYLRLKGKKGDAAATIEFPDGTIHTFLRADAATGLYRLSRIVHRRVLSNHSGSSSFLDLTYSADGLTWTLKDGIGRTHTITFASPGPGLFYDKVVSKVELTAFAGKTATYDFFYDTPEILRDCTGDSDPQLPARLSVPLLSRIEGPEGLLYEPDYYVDDFPPSDMPGCQVSGKMSSLKLPTGGRIAWEYGKYEFPTQAGCNFRQDIQFCSDPFRMNVGVAKRTVFADILQPKTPTAVWRYDQELRLPSSPPPGCLVAALVPEETRTVVTDPLGNTSTSYYSVNLFGTQQDEDEYGLPYVRRLSDGAGRYLSREDRAANGTLLRSEYVRYVLDRSGVQGNGDNRRLVSSRMVDKEGRYQQTDFRDFDGLGNFRTVVSGGDISDQTEPDRTTFRDYNPGRGTFCGLDPGCTPVSGPFVPPARHEPWILGLFGREEAAQVGHGETRLSCFDPTTGDLLARRTFASTATAAAPEGPSDLLTVFAHDPDGNVLTTRFFGGDRQHLPTGLFAYTSVGHCTATPPADAEEYKLRQTYLHGTLASSRFVQGQGGAARTILQPFDNDIDENTGLVAASRDAAGLETTHTYDLLGRPLATTPHLHELAATEYDYHFAGVDDKNNPVHARIVVSRRALNNQLLTRRALQFDGLGRTFLSRTRIPDPDPPDPAKPFEIVDQVTRYDPLGRIRSQTVPSLEADGPPTGITRFEYDPLGRLTLTTQPDGSPLRNKYIGEGRVERTVRIGGVDSTTEEVYDSLGRLVSVTEPSGADGAKVTTRYAYDAADRLREVSTKIGQLTQRRIFTYDGRGFLASETHPEIGANGGGSVHYSGYDARGNVGRRAIAGGPYLDFVYDRAGRTTQVRGSATPDPLKEQILKELFYAPHGSSRFDDKKGGRLVQSKRHHYVPDLRNPNAPEPQDIVVTENRVYGGRGGLLSQLRVRTSIGLSTVHSYAYTPLGDPLTLSYPSCDRPPCPGDLSPGRTLVSSFNQGLLTSLWEPASPLPHFYVRQIRYHPDGSIAGVDHGNGVTDGRQRDPHGMPRPRSITVAKAGASPLWASGPYAFDGAGNITGIGEDRFTYDKVGRLLTGDVHWTEGSGTQTLTYDAFGNILTKETGPPGEKVDEPLEVDPASNRLDLFGTEYDAAGNVERWSGRSYSWDPLQRMSRITGTGVNHAYLYDSSDNRVAIFDYMTREMRWRPRGLNDKVLTDFVWGYDTGEVRRERDYVFRGAALVASVEGDVQGPAHEESHYHLDHLGSTRVVTDGQGLESGSYTYWPFGELASSGRGDRLLFTGHERDFNCPQGVCDPAARDDLDYMLARHYSPVVGRFLSVDPVLGNTASPQSWNRYTYAMNGPLLFVDPDGQADTPFWNAASDVAIRAGELLALIGSAANAPVVVAAGLAISAPFLTRKIDNEVTERTGDAFLVDKVVLGLSTPLNPVPGLVFAHQLEDFILTTEPVESHDPASAEASPSIPILRERVSEERRMDRRIRGSDFTYESPRTKEAKAKLRRAEELFSERRKVERVVPQPPTSTPDQER